MLKALHRLRAYPEHLRFKLYPVLARHWLEWACRPAERKLHGKPPLRMLIDTCVLGHAVTHETRWISTGEVEWCGAMRSTGYAARVPIHSRKNGTDDYRDVCYLTAITNLVRKGRIMLFTSAELEEEQVRQPAGRCRGYSYFDYSLLSGIPMPSVDGSAEEMITPTWTASAAAARQRQRIAGSGDLLYEALFERLKHQLGPNGTQDAWHVRTAEQHGMFCFLTMDRPLLNACRQLAKKEPLRSLTTRIMSPTDFAAQLGLRRMPPDMLSYNDASWFVRRDHTMPGETRRKLRDYERHDKDRGAQTGSG